jgi:MFS transporter, SHS family, lactate transporter
MGQRRMPASAEPEVWLENRRRQRAERREMRVPLFSIFKPAILG